MDFETKTTISRAQFAHQHRQFTTGQEGLEAKARSPSIEKKTSIILRRPVYGSLRRHHAVIGTYVIDQTLPQRTRVERRVGP